MSIGSWDTDSSDTSPSVPLPTSPVYGTTAGGAVGGAAVTGETPELVLEYWSPKGQKEKVCEGGKQVSVGARCFPRQL